jgi:hypothetical protein
MLRDGDWFLSLAVPVDDLAARLSDSDVISQALAGVMAGLAAASEGERSTQAAGDGALG